MQPDAATPRLAMVKPVAAIPDAWRAPLLRLAAAWMVLFALTAADWAQMADQWWNSSTYNHILLVPVIIGWLVYVRLPALAKIKPSSWLIGFVWLGGALMLWLLSRFAAFNLGAHIASVAMLQGAVLITLGPRVGAALVFPLAYMFFLVPFGDELVPALQMITANLTIWLTELSGIPAAIEGVFIDTPAGLFEVAEACSGVKFLVAMVALSTLISNVAFQSRKRRAAFMALAVIVPIIANGIRAWGTIYIAQFAGVEFAAGFDHIFYGWIFFALVLALVMAIGWKFFDRAADAQPVDGDAINHSELLDKLALFSMTSWKAPAAIAAFALVFGAWNAGATQLEAELPGQMYLPQIEGWQQVDYAPAVWWEPRATGAAHKLLARYRDAQGREVDLFLAVYAKQADGSEAGAFGEGALVPDTEWRWLSAGPTMQDAQTTVLQALGQIQRLTASSYRKGDTLTGSTAALKLATMRDKLTMRARPVSVLIVSAERTPATPDPAAAIADFRQATGDQGAFVDGIVNAD